MYTGVCVRVCVYEKKRIRFTSASRAAAAVNARRVCFKTRRKRKKNR